jgi:hypothetical protein
MLSLPIPSPADAAEAAAAGVVAPCPGLAAAAASGGVRLFGLLDPSCGGVPEGCVAVRPELVPPDGWAVICRWGNPDMVRIGWCCRCRCCCMLTLEIYRCVKLQKRRPAKFVGEVREHYVVLGLSLLLLLVGCGVPASQAAPLLLLEGLCDDEDTSCASAPPTIKNTLCYVLCDVCVCCVQGSWHPPR